MEPTDANTPEDSAKNDAAFTPVVVGHCSSLNEAQVVVSLLASFGIDATIDSENYFRMLGSMLPGFAGVPVRVRQLDAEAAMEILEQGPQAPGTKDER